MRLNCQILSPISETSELNGMKNFAIKNRVLQRDRVLQRRILERYYCTMDATAEIRRFPYALIVLLCPARSEQSCAEILDLMILQQGIDHW